ncbi:MAG: hypothetical protein QXP06_07455 [Candidatus Bathyarchaeia archaeon]
MSEKAELLQRIKRLRDKVGEIYPIIETPERVLDGHHRLEACPDWKERKIVTPKNPYEEALIWFAAHERRKVSKKEVQVKLLTMAEHLLKSGVERGQIIKQIAEDTGYNEKYIASMLPAKYKAPQKVKAAEKAVEIKPVYKEEVKKEVEKMKVKQPKKYLCPICGNPLALVGDLLVPYHEALKTS